MLKIVHFVRHGEVDNPKGILYGRIPGFKLSQSGREQAAMTAKFFSTRERAVSIYSSPLIRALETAKIISSNNPQILDTNIRVLPNVVESKNFFEGKVLRSFNGGIFNPHSWAKLFNPLTPSWSEPYKNIALRMVMSLQYIVDRTDWGKESICVSHQLPIEILRRAITKQKLYHNPRKRLCDLASVTSFIFKDNFVHKVKYWSQPNQKSEIIWNLYD